MKAVIVDDELAMHLIIKRMLGKFHQVEVAACFQETASAFSYIHSHPVDLVFVDIHMPGESGLEFAKRLRDNDWEMKIVFVTSHKDYALPAFSVYAYDYIVKPLSQQRLDETVERVLAEGEGTNPNPHGTVSPLIEPLTRRETEVLQLMSNGLSNKEIAEKFKLSEGTIKNHIVNIFGKLQVKNRVQATINGKRYKLIR
ncbi:MAG TPA: response regulator transcription factor [Bacillales bacterium]|nr:response regulator transcription factor [Bacillales bacterium]